MPFDHQRRRLSVVALVPLGIVMLVIWAAMPRDSAAAGPSPLGPVGVLVVFACCFSALALNVAGRLAVMAFGAFACVLLGSLLRFYSPADALVYLWGKVDTLLLLVGLGAVTGILAESGFFARVAYRIVRTADGHARRAAVSLCMGTYLLSCFVNNLATILVLVPLSLVVADALDIDAETLVLGEVIASNLGGASTMIGDFPNMLIATESGLPFHEFLWHLAPVCLTQLVILDVCLFRALPTRGDNARAVHGLLEQLAQERWEPRAASRGLAIMVGMVAGFVVGGELNLSPAVIAAAGGALAFLLGGIPARTLVRHMCLDDALFFACLFVMVGAVDAAGVLHGLGQGIARVWRQSPALGSIVIAWSAALATAVLNAGPTTALFLHVLSIGPATAVTTEPMCWALSLGVCAGSSATLTGATAGPVAASLLEQRGHTMTFGSFARTGVRVAVVFLAVSACYLVAWQ